MLQGLHTPITQGLLQSPEGLLLRYQSLHLDLGLLGAGSFGQAVCSLAVQTG